MSGFVRTGRGGAGNFINQKDVEEAEKAQHANDPESQPASAPPVVPASQAPQYVRSGRGGAGNFADPPTLAESQAREDVVDRTEVAVNTSQAGKPRVGLSGRGGAGNWTDSDAAKDSDADNDVQSRQSRIEDKIVHDIEASLPPPPRTYHQHDRNMEK
ncbi:hypothetical protein N0V93_005014 [Gnomoniopsis smithogilvyi]|uniref:Uncharacterized protein n=1 Tax=Gnomoniopsis smithogilvyi TaxID=1191159 RepID=A0A9W9CWC2_9PEZI|nr:hypothetical protein N0V93_005014 [Gnomoniopsis smithogilvyi]